MGKKKRQSKGLGDTVEKITEATGIKKVFDLFTDGRDCGCEERKKILNNLFPYNKPNCMNEEQYNAWTKIKAEIEKTNKISPENQTIIISMLRSIMNLAIHNDNCKDCSGEVWKKYIDMLNKVYDTYEA